MRLRLPVLLALVGLALSACAFRCGTQEASRATSPDGALDAIVHVRNCGATTDFNTNVSILRAGEAASEPGQVFVAERGGAPLSAIGGVAVQLRWLGPRHLLVTFDGRAEVYRQVVREGGIRIDYRTAPPDAPARR
jgi:hypothetical protein